MSAPHLMLRRIASILRYTQVAALVLASGIGVLIWNTAQRFEAADAWVEHSHQVLLQLELARASTLRSGLWLRNFVIAANPSALVEVKDSGEAALRAATALQQLTVDNPDQQARAHQVASAVRTAIGALESAAVIGEIDGPSPVNLVLVARLKRDSTRDLRLALDDMEAHEKTILSRRFAEQAGHMAWLKRLCFGGGVAFAMFMTWSIVYSSRLMRVGHSALRELDLDASQDPLTGLMNRRALQDAIDRFPMHQAMAVMAFDLDDFKPVNDRLGHAAGDQALQEVANRLRIQCRDRDLIARVGGDEFLIIFPTVKDWQRASLLERRIHLALREPIRLQAGIQVKIGASIGTAVRGIDGDAVADLMRLADRRSFEAKKLSKARTALSLVNAVSAAL